MHQVLQIGWQELTSLWSESDVMVKELAELHHHVGELLSAWLRAALPWSLVHCVGHLPRANIHLGSGRQLCTTEAGNEQQIPKNFANLARRVQVSRISRLPVIRFDQSTHPNGSRSPILVPQVVALAVDSAKSVESLAVNSLTHAHFVCGSC